MDRTAKAGRLRLVAALGAVAVIAPVAAGCGDDATGPPAPAGDGTSVEVADFAFGPTELDVGVGETVTWENAGQEIHNVKGKGFFSGGLAAGEAYDRRFTEPGTYRYVCTLHPTQMRGLIRVGKTS